MKFGHVILRKIFKFVATRCQILRLKCTKFNFGWGSTPDPAEETYSAPTDPLAEFKGSSSKEREGKRLGIGEWNRERGGEARKERGGKRMKIERERTPNSCDVGNPKNTLIWAS